MTPEEAAAEASRRMHLLQTVDQARELYLALPCTNQEGWTTSPRRGLDQLAPHPLRRRMLGHMDVLDAPAGVGYEEEDVERRERDRRYGEEVARPDLVTVVVKEGSPGG